MKVDDLICPCSSGGAETTFFQSFKFKKNQLCVNNKALASMGYGLPGAIGLALSNKKKELVYLRVMVDSHKTCKRLELQLLIS